LNSGGLWLLGCATDQPSVRISTSIVGSSSLRVIEFGGSAFSSIVGGINTRLRALLSRPCKLLLSCVSNFSVSEGLIECTEGDEGNNEEDECNEIGLPVSVVAVKFIIRAQ